MQAGRLNSRVTIKRRATGQDAIGQPVTTLETVATVWANILHQSGRETIKSGADTSIVQASIRVRLRTDLDAGMEVHHGTKVYEVSAVLPGDDWIDLVCQVVR